MLKWFCQVIRTIKIAQLNRQVIRLDRQGQYERAIEIATQACDLARQHLGEEHPCYATTLNNLAGLYEATGNYPEAEQLYQQVLERIRLIDIQEHPEFAACLNNQAMLYQKMGNCAEAQKLHQQALEIRRKDLGDYHPEVSNSLNNLASLYQSIGDYKEAEKLYIQALEIRRKTLGEEHPNFATTLHNLAVLYHEVGDYTQAEVFLQQALDITSQVQGEDHPDFAASINTQAMLYEAMGKYAEAKLLYQKVIDIQRRTLGEKHPDFATGLQNLGQLLYEVMGDYAKAEPILHQSLQIRRKALGEKHPDFAIGLGCLAELYEAMGNYDRAEVFLQQALDINRTALGDGHPNLARSMSSLAQLYETMGDYAKAKPLYNQAYKIMREKLGERHPNFAMSLQDLAECSSKLGNYAEAEPLLQQALEIERINKREKHPDFAVLLGSLASLYAEMGNYAAAKPLYQQAIDIQRNALGEKHPDLSTSLHSLAILNYDMGDYAKIEPLLQEALDIAYTVQGEKHSDVAMILNSLALLYESMKQYDRAESIYHNAIKIIGSSLGEKHSSFAMITNNLAQLYRATGQYAKAEPLYQKVRTITRTALGEKHPSFAISLHNLAELYKEMGDYVKAEQLYQQDREITYTVLGKKHPSLAISLRNFATLYVATDRKTEALDLVEKAAVINNQMIGQVFSIGSESQRMAYLKTLNTNLSIFSSLVTQYLFHSSIAVQAALNLVLRRKGIGAEALAAQRDTILGGRYPALASKLKELSILRMQIAQKTLAGSPSAEELQQHKRLLDEWNGQREQLEAELARQVPEISLQQKLQTTNWQEIAQALPATSVLVEFVRFDAYDFKAVPAKGEEKWQSAQYLAFIMLADEPENLQMINLGEAEFIDRAIAKFRAFITGKTELRGFETVEKELIPEFADRGIELRRKIFDPLLKAIGDRQRLFLAPDGDLNKLPFEVLPTDDRNRLIDKYHISYLSTARDVLRFGVQSKGKPAEPLVIADPDFDLGGKEATEQYYGKISRDFDQRSLNFQPLPGTRKEGEQIAKMLDVEPWFKGEVLEARLKAERSPRILHIATHGFFLKDQKRDLNREHFGNLDRLSGVNLENPLLRSGLALAGANTWLKKGSLPPEAEDGILTAEDVSGLDLLDTELVVLSACETGLGEVQTGEGVFGLRRAFVLAGAKTLVMSLWKVPDQQTEELMTNYYRRILAGEPRGEALRAAQLEMKKKYPNPLYWGAFICQGEISSLLQRP